MTKKPITLSNAISKKPSATPPRAESAKGGTKTLTLRLPEIAHNQLREMAFSERKSQHSLLLEAVNLLFERDGKPPVAS